MKLIPYYLMRIKEVLLKKNHFIQFYQNSYGLKNVSAAVLLNGRFYEPLEIDLKPVNSLYLGPDYLKDEYTLLNTPIIDSPHFYFVKAINEGLDLFDTDYIQRYMKGTLDWRRGKRKPQNIGHFKEDCAQSKIKIENDNYEPVLAYFQNNHYYIYDGKHRAAMCAYMGKPVLCKIVSSEIANIGVWHYMFSLLENKKEFSKHINFHNDFLNAYCK